MLIKLSNCKNSTIRSNKHTAVAPTNIKSNNSSKVLI